MYATILIIMELLLFEMLRDEILIRQGTNIGRDVIHKLTISKA